MSITINGTTNTLTAASGLTIAGNTAVTGTLSATGLSSFATGQLQADATYGATAIQVGVGGIGASRVWHFAASGSDLQFIESGVAVRGTWSPTGLAVTGKVSANAGSTSFEISAAGRNEATAVYLRNTTAAQASPGVYFYNGDGYRHYIQEGVGTAGLNIQSVDGTPINLVANTAVTGTLSATGVTTLGTASALRSGFATILASSSTYNHLVVADSNAYNASPIAQITLSGKYTSGGTYADWAYIRGSKVNSTDGDQFGQLSLGVNSGGGAANMLTLTSSLLNTINGVVVSVSDTTDATSTTAASLKTAGGLGVAKKGYFGDNIVMASGKGIDFSATSDGSGTTTSEVLSDYEEGTWTPTFTTSGVDFSGVTYAINAGHYTKIGRQVFVTGFLRTSSITVGSATGSVLIGGLPFTPASNNNNYGTVSIGTSVNFADDRPSAGRVSSGTTKLELLYRDAVDGDTIDLLVADMGTGASANSLAFSCNYYV